MSNLDILYSNGWECTSHTNDEMMGRCPSFNHVDNRPSFSINVHTGAFRCFSCGFRGKHPATLLSGIKNISYEEAKEELFGVIDFGLKEKILGINQRLASFFFERKTHIIIEEIEKRGMDKLLVQKYCVGYVPDTTTQFFTQKELELSGLIKRGFFLPEGRMSFPIFNKNNIIGFSCRDIDGKSFAANKKKYLSLYNSEYFPEDSWLYGIDYNASEVHLCEGVFDAIMLRESGYNGAALLGLHCSPERMLLLRRFKKIYLCFDNDRAGIEAAEKFYFDSREILTHNKIFVTELFYGKDPGELTKDQIEKVVCSSVPAIQWVVMNSVTNACTPDELVKSVSRLKEKISLVRNEVEKIVLNKLLDIRLKTGVTFDENFKVINF